MNALFVVALAMPALAGAVALAAPTWRTADRGVRVLSSLAAVVDVVVLVGGGVERAGRFHARPLALVAMIGLAVVVAAIRPSRSGADVVVLVGVWQVATLTVAAGVGDASALPVAVGVAVVAALLVPTTVPRLLVALVLAGGALVALGFAVGGEATATFRPQALAAHGVGSGLALAGVAVTLAGALLADRSPAASAVVPALAVAVALAPQVTNHAAVAVPFAFATGAAAVLAPRRPALAVAFGAVAVLAIDVTAGVLLAAAAVVVGAVPSALLLLAALPGAVGALDVAVGHRGAAPVTVVAALGVAGVALVALGSPVLRIPRPSLPASAAGAWLALAPSRSSWASPVTLPHWDRGAALALAAGLLAVVALGLREGGTFRPLLADEPNGDGEAADPTLPRRAIVAGLVALGIASGALVRSALRSV